MVPNQINSDVVLSHSLFEQALAVAAASGRRSTRLRKQRTAKKRVRLAVDELLRLHERAGLPMDEEYLRTTTGEFWMCLT